MPPSRPSHPPAPLAFDSRQERVVEGMARWMGLLGRFRVLAGGLVILGVIGLGLAVATTLALERRAPAEESAPPLVDLPSVPPHVIALVGAGLLVLGALVLASGIRLTDSSEDFERVVHASGGTTRNLESAVLRLSAYFRLEAALAAIALAAYLALSWGLAS